MVTRTGVPDRRIQFHGPQWHDYATHLLYTSALRVLPIIFPSNYVSEIRIRTPFERHTQMRHVIAVGQSRRNQNICLSVLGQSESRMCRACSRRRPNAKV